ncbi:MAG: ATP-binding cassette domain-containing protein [Planctomycetota bacterium]
MGPPVLQLRGVSKRFPAKPKPVQALDDVSLELRAGGIVGLVGPDGAGKTSLLRLSAGLLAPERGEIRALGVDIVHDPLPAQEHLGYMPQQFGLYTELTVRENLDLYADLRGQPPEQRPERYEALMTMTGLGPFTGRLAGRLSGGMQQKLGLACVLVRSSRLLLLDEPTAGVDPVSRRELWTIIRRLVAEEQAGVLLSTGYLDEAEGCDQVVVLDEGKMLGQGTPSQLTQPVQGRTFSVSAPNQAPRDLQTRLARLAEVTDAAVEVGKVRIVLQPNATPNFSELLSDLSDVRVREVPPRLEDGVVTMLAQNRRHGRESNEGSPAKPRGDPMAGGKPSAGASAPPPPVAEGTSPIIKVAGLKRFFGNFRAVKGLEFGVAPGEVFGLLGANGAGKSTTFRMLCGLLPPSEGTLRVAGVDMRRAPARARARIGYMSQTFSLYGNLTVLENLRFFSSAYGLFGKQRRARLNWALGEFQLEPWKHRRSEILPLGYRQRLALAAALIHEPRILFLDEPTSGVDPLARREFWQRISGQAAAGVTVMVTTHFMEEAEYCDRLAIMMAGELLTLGSPAEIRKQAETPDQPRPTVEDAFIQLIESRQRQTNN